MGASPGRFSRLSSGLVARGAGQPASQMNGHHGFGRTEPGLQAKWQISRGWGTQPRPVSVHGAEPLTPPFAQQNLQTPAVRSASRLIVRRKSCVPVRAGGVASAMGDTPLIVPAPTFRSCSTRVLAVLAPLAGARILDGTFGAGAIPARVCSRRRFDRRRHRPRSCRRPLRRGTGGHPSGALPLRARRLLRARYAGRRRSTASSSISASLDAARRAGRGFSFMREGPLDMRMAGDGESAADLVNTLADAASTALRAWRGTPVPPHRHSIVAARATAPIRTTTELAPPHREASAAGPATSTRDRSFRPCASP